MNDQRPVGKTKSVGYQIGVRRTFDIKLESAWNFLISEEGLFTWLGSGSPINAVVGERYRLPDGTTGEFRVIKTNSHLRLTWHPQGWEKASTIQVRVLPAKNKTTISFHQENLPGSVEREQRKTFYMSALDEIRKRVSQV
ncbi:MAG: SRPBCC domain-containing protein [Calditrichaceae bacterium]